MRIVGGEFGGTPLGAPKGEPRDLPESVRAKHFFQFWRHKPIFRSNMRACLIFLPALARWGWRRFHAGGIFAFLLKMMRVRGTLRDNCEACGVLGRTKIYRRDATRLGARMSSAGPVFNMVFADPPYGKKLAEAALGELVAGDWLANQALLVVEEDRRAGFEAPAGFTETQRRNYGDTELVFLKFTGA